MVSVGKITCLLLLCFAISEANEIHQRSIKKTRSSDQCKRICPQSGNYIEEIFRIKNILVFESLSEKAAIALDLDNYYLVAVNSESQVIIIFNLHSKVYYRVQDSQVAWNSSDSFSTYLKSINNFNTIVKFAKQNGQNGQSVEDISDSVLQEYIRIEYGVGYSNIFTKDTLLYHVNELLPSLIDLLRGPLQGYLQDTNRVKSIYGVDFQATLVGALESLFSYASGSLQALQKDGVKLDYNLIMNVNSGFEILLIVLENVGEHEDLAKVFSRVLTRPELILTFVAQFNSTGGVDPIFNVIYRIIQASEGQGSTSNIYRMIISIAENFNPNSFSSELQSIILEIARILQTQSQRFNNSQQLQGLNNFIQALQNNNLNIGGINISELIQTIIRNVPNVLRTIIQVFSQISNGSGSGLNISQIIQQITQYLSQNLDSISELFPGLHISSGDFGSILEEIIENFNIDDILDSSGSGENIISILSRIPVIGDIIREIQRVIPSANIEDLQKIFNPQNILRIGQRIFPEIQRNTNFQDIIKIIIKEIGTIVQSNGGGGSDSDGSSSSSSDSGEGGGSGSSEGRHHTNNNGNGH